MKLLIKFCLQIGRIYLINIFVRIFLIFYFFFNTRNKFQRYDGACMFIKKQNTWCVGFSGKLGTQLKPNHKFRI